MSEAEQRLDVPIQGHDLPDYVCCVVTEGIWTWFGTILLSVILLTVATLKYCRTRFKKPRFLVKNQNLLLKSVIADDNEATKRIPKSAIRTEDFPRHCLKRRKHQVVDDLEFATIVKSCQFSDITVALKAENAPKNQNANSVPFDYNRVRLLNQNEDYVNASYVGNCMNKRAWIVSQGPMEGTFLDFWNMVWQEKSPVIVMLTKTFEFIKIMCFQYWPAHLHKLDTYGRISVTLTQEESYADYKVRHFLICNGNEARVLRQYHYTAWPVNAPTPPNSILNFRHRLRLDMESMALTGPPIVHCNDGGSRSGCFLAIDDNLLMSEQSRQIDIFGTVKYLKEQRKSLLTTSEHLRYVYDVVEDFLLCGDTKLPMKGLLQELISKSKKDPQTGFNAYQREHGLLDSLLPRFSIGDCAAGHRAENRAKNRNVLIVPPDENRPRLTSFQGTETSDYINAVFVDGYRMADEFICTEWPLNNTISNFWSLVYDQNIKTIVVLNHPKSNQSQSYPTFWPKDLDSVKSYGPVFHVENSGFQDYDEGKFSAWDLQLFKQDLEPKTMAMISDRKDISSLNNLLSNLRTPAKPLKLFQIHCWPPNQNVPNSTLALVHLIAKVDQWRGSDTNLIPDDKVLVISQDGYSRCGIFCTTAACLEQVYHRQEVDVFQAVKTVRQHRPQLVANTMEYKYCYDVVLHYVMNYIKPSQPNTTDL